MFNRNRRDKVRVVMYKETGELSIARKIWLESDFEIPENGYSIQMNAAQDGWAFENSHGVVFILPTNLMEYFEDLGEL